ncbi:hypothetical protein KM043_001619 [Ampulex compressa]|nr:hypothetical protein KM043_001619 [Ampulex compressa]
MEKVARCAPWENWAQMALARRIERLARSLLRTRYHRPAKSRYWKPTPHRGPRTRELARTRPFHGKGPKDPRRILGRVCQRRRSGARDTERGVESEMRAKERPKAGASFGALEEARKGEAGSERRGESERWPERPLTRPPGWTIGLEARRRRALNKGRSLETSGAD